MAFHVRHLTSTQMGGSTRWCYEITVDGNDSFEENFCYGLDFPPGVKISKASAGQMAGAPDQATPADISGPWTAMLPSGQMKGWYVAYACPKPRARSIVLCFMARDGMSPKTDVSLQKVFDEAVNTSLWRDIDYENSVMPAPAGSG